MAGNDIGGFFELGHEEEGKFLPFCHLLDGFKGQVYYS